MKDEHAQRIAAERALMEQTGASRSQIRDAFFGSPLRDALVRMQGAQTPASGVPAPLPPKIETTEQSLKPNPILTPAPPSVVVPVNGKHQFLVVENAVLQIWNLSGEYVSDA